jgi:hypothetical protein
MRTRLWFRFWLEALLAALAAALAVLTLITREWIELLFRIDPDHGNGSLEWLIVAVLGVAACVLALRAPMNWRRARLAVS